MTNKKVRGQNTIAENNPQWPFIDDGIDQAVAMSEGARSNTSHSISPPFSTVLSLIIEGWAIKHHQGNLPDCNEWILALGRLLHGSHWLQGIHLYSSIALEAQNTPVSVCEAVKAACNHEAARTSLHTALEARKSTTVGYIPFNGPTVSVRPATRAPASSHSPTSSQPAKPASTPTAGPSGFRLRPGFTSL